MTDEGIEHRVSPGRMIVLMQDVIRKTTNNVYLVPNVVGNLAIYDGDDYVGYVDLADRKVYLFNES